MNMIEVDPKLFITCRLCLDELGQYQIVPQVQMQIKYCFDIEVAPFDGLPQLICKKCESILSQYAGIKQLFQEKQNSLKLKIIENETKNTSSNKHQQQQQDTVSSTQQVDSDCNKSIKGQTKSKKIQSNSRTSSADRESCKENTNVICIKKNVKRARSLWKKDYVKYFVCRFCTESYKDKRSINNHLKQCNFKVKYSNDVQRCFVKLDRMSSRPNLTSSNENVVYKKDKIINCRNKNYYILYTLKSFEKCESSSDEDFVMDKNKHKRRRLVSRSSNETLVIDGNHISKNSQLSDNEEEKTNLNQTKQTDVSDIECVHIDDSDSTLSCNSKAVTNNEELSECKSPTKLFVESEKVIQNVITMCQNKFLKRLDDMSVGKKINAGYVDHCLQPKILSMGQKVITSTGLNSTGLIRYMEHKDLDVIWIQKKQKTVHIKTTLRNDKNNDSSYPIWKSLKGLDKYYTPNDFIDYFEKTKINYKSLKNNTVTNSVTQREEKNCVDEVEKTSTPGFISEYLEFIVKNSYSMFNLKTSDREKRTMLRKLLNENPVANPKQLPKKASSSELISLFSNEQMSNCDKNIDKNNDEQTMPIIISTISLANNVDSTDNGKEITQTADKPESLVDPKSQLALHRIKVKPVSELMPEIKLNQPPSSVTPTNNWHTNFYNGSQNIFVQNEDIPVVYVTNNAASCSNTNSQQTNDSYPQYKMNANSSNILIIPCSIAGNGIVNPQQNEQDYTSNYSQYNTHTHRSNIIVPPNSNASSGIINSEQPNTSSSDSTMNPTSSNIYVTPIIYFT